MVAHMVILSDSSPVDVADAVMACGEDAAEAVTRLLLLRLRSHPLTRLLDSWDLSATAGAALFGVSRQAFTKWLSDGPPADRADDVAGFDAAVNTLATYLRPERISAVVRRPSPALGGVSLLDFAVSHTGRETAAAAAAMFDLRVVQP